MKSEIRRSEAQLRSIFESSGDGILVTLDNGTIINANDRFYKMWQLPDEFKEEPQESLLIPVMMGKLRNQDITRIKTEQLHRANIEGLDEIYFKDGRIFERFSRPLILGGKTIGRVWNFKDVTDRKRSFQALRESEARFRQLSDAALEAIVIHDNGIILQANDQFLNMFGYARKEVIGRLQFINCISVEYRKIIDLKTNSYQLNFLEVDGVKKRWR